MAVKLARFSLPEETTRHMNNSLLSRIVLVPRTTTGPDGQFNASGFQPFRLLPGMTRDEVTPQLNAVENACRAARKSDVAPLVAELLARTKGRAQGEGEARLMVEVMVNDLSKYPLDIVRSACNAWVDQGKEGRFFPSWPELKEICEKLMQGRKALRNALMYAYDLASKPIDPDAKPKFVPEPYAVRLRTMRDAYGRIADMDRATKYERLLALQEGREPSL